MLIMCFQIETMKTAVEDFIPRVNAEEGEGEEEVEDTNIYLIKRF